MTRIGRYEIVSELGRGAMGIVYRANDPVIGRTVAIKTIRLGEITDPQEHQRLRERLFREARSAGILSHPNIVTVYDIGEEGDLAYIAMEFVNGSTLEHAMRSDSGPEKHVILSVMYETGGALDYAHQKGIIHRDIKPANIMINENGAVKITDFGVAKILSQQVTQADLVLGTPSYMSPEQIEAKGLDGRSDQFALAVIAYELTTGEKPFVADSLPSLLFRIVREDPVEPSHLNPTLGPETGQVLFKAMAKKSADRYPTCAEFVQALTDSLSLHPAWRPLSRAAMSNMATVATPMPEAPVAALLGQTTTDSGSPAAPMEMGHTAAMDAPAPPPAPPAPAAAEARAPSPPPPSVAEPSQAPLPPRVRREALEQQPSRRRLVLAVACVVVALAGVGWFAGRAMFPSAPEPASPDSAQLPEPPPAPPPPPPSTTEADQATAKPVPEPPPVEVPSRPPIQPAKPVGSTPSQPALVRIDVTSEPPGATASFDDGATGCTTPCPIELASGRHVVRVTRAGYRDALRIFNAPEESRLVIRLDRLMGLLAIKSTPPDAEIIINGQARSERTPVILNLPAGRYKIVLRKPGYHDYEEEVDVRDQVTRTIEVSWSPGG